MFIWMKQPNNGRRYPLEQASNMHSKHLNLRTWMQMSHDSRQWLVGRLVDKRELQSTLTMKPHFSGQNLAMAFPPWNIVKYLSHQLWVLWSCRKNLRRNLPADQAAMGFAQVLEGAVEKKRQEKKTSRDFTINGHFTCQFTLFVGVRYPMFPPLLWRKRWRSD